MRGLYRALRPSGRAVFGDAADEYLVRYVRLLREQPGTWMSGGAYVSAVR